MIAEERHSNESSREIQHFCSVVVRLRLDGAASKISKKIVHVFVSDIRLYSWCLIGA